jgi:hypothetical protein
MLGNFWVAERLEASQEWLSSMQFVLLSAQTNKWYRMKVVLHIVNSVCNHFTQGPGSFQSHGKTVAYSCFIPRPYFPVHSPSKKTSKTLSSNHLLYKDKVKTWKRRPISKPGDITVTLVFCRVNVCIWVTLGLECIIRIWSLHMVRPMIVIIGRWRTLQRKSFTLITCICCLIRVKSLVFKICC